MCSQGSLSERTKYHGGSHYPVRDVSCLEILGIVLLILCGATEKAAFVVCDRDERDILLWATRRGGAALLQLFSTFLNSYLGGVPEFPTTITRSGYLVTLSHPCHRFKAARSELGAHLIGLSIC